MSRNALLAATVILVGNAGLAGAVADDLATARGSIESKWSQYKTVRARYVLEKRELSHDLEWVVMRFEGTLEASYAEGNKQRFEGTISAPAPEGEPPKSYKIVMINEGGWQWTLLDDGSKKVATKERGAAFAIKPKFQSFGMTYKIRALPETEVKGEAAHVIEESSKTMTGTPPPRFYDSSIRRVTTYVRKSDLMPIKIETTFGGQWTERTTLDDIEINPTIDPKRFILAVPPGVEIIDKTK